MALSSTMRALRLARLRVLLAAGDRSLSARANDSSNQNVDPSPGALTSPSLPPMSSTSCRQIASPRPVPPNLRVVDESAWAKARNKRSWSAAAIPMPMSITSNRSATRSVFSSRTRTRMTTSPSKVNLTALEPRLSSTCWILTASPRSASGTSGWMSIRSSSPLLWAEPARIRPTSSAMLGTLTGASSRSS